MGPKCTPTAASSSASTVRVTVQVDLPAALPEAAEWVVVEHPPRLLPAVRDRLAARLSSRSAKASPKDRIEAAWEAGYNSRDKDLAAEDVVRPPGLGISNSCWLGVRVDQTVWVVVRRRAAAEAEAWVLGYGLDQRSGTLPIAETSNDPEWLLLRLPGETSVREAAVVPILRRVGGLLLGMDSSFITATEIASGTIANVTSALGPTRIVQVDGLPDDEDADPVEISMLLVDWPQSHYKFLLGGGTAPNWPVGTIFPHSAEEVFHAVNYDQLDEGPQTDAYHTAPEAAPSRPPAAPDDLLAQILAQTQDTAALVNRLQTEQLVGAAPKTRALATVKGGRQDTGAGALGDEDVEEDAEELPLDQLLKAALVGMLDKKKPKTKSRTTGLPLTMDHSDSEGEEDPLRRLSGAKGTMLLEKLRFAMESESQAYINAIEGLAAQTLGEASASAHTMEKYIKDQLPIGAERTLGYMVWGIGRALTLLRGGETAKAHLVLLLLITATEHFKLDNTWSSAWRITHLTPPPFSDWRTRGEHHLAQLRSDHSHTRLAHATWMAAIAAKLKDEEVLTKKRFQNQGDPPNRPDRPPRGRGRGKGAQEAPNTQ
ncbi:unnamed protein product [Symbiodinium necroappetens]|uniref:Uncharacterized protein n=1 Tax=Symbiodinium necroappetens TaxID=1628268 RepID=A0A812R4N1_9DINO|nr:unnamed protein product [Symbiodinium necroappetens]